MDLKSFEVTARSGRKFTLRELDSLQQINADSLVPDEANGNVGAYFRVAMAIHSIEGKALDPVHSAIEMQARMKLVKGSELDDLVKQYYLETVPTRKELKKESPPDGGKQD